MVCDAEFVEFVDQIFQEHGTLTTRSYHTGRVMWSCMGNTGCEFIVKSDKPVGTANYQHCIFYTQYLYLFHSTCSPSNNVVNWWIGMETSFGTIRICSQHSAFVDHLVGEFHEFRICRPSVIPP